MSEKMDMRSLLDPCQCGEAVDIRIYYGVHSFANMEWARIECESCGRSLKKTCKDAAEIAVKTWNHRPTEDALRKRVGELEGEKARIIHDFASMLIAIVPKAILDEAIDEALTPPATEAEGEHA